MHLSRVRFFSAFLFILVATGCNSGTDEATDVSDPGFLPTGTYDLRIIAASCNVNRSFQNAGHMALFRNPPGKPAGANIPVPSQMGTANGSLFDTPRQDVDLTKGYHFEFDREDDDRSVTTSIDVTEFSEKHLAIAYGETPADALSGCSVEYSFELVEAACPRDCHSQGATLSVSSGGSMIWHCLCE